LRAAEREHFEEILASTDIDKVGHYIDDVIGDFNVLEYVANKDVARRVNSCIAKLTAYVGTEEDVLKEQLRAPSPPERARAEVGAYDVDLHVQVAENVWNALAALRRTLEIELRGLGERHGIRPHRAMGAGGWVKILRDRELLPPRVAEDLTYSIPVLNQAVHGFDVPLDQAKEVVYLVMRSIHAIREQ
jgi:hypothetical protein